MFALRQKQTLQSVRPMSALPPKADINHRERDVGFVAFCSVDNLARNTEGAHGRSSPKSLICRPAASDRLHKKSIFCTKSSPLMALYVQSPLPVEAAATLTAFREAIRDLGYIEGQTIVLDFRLSKGIMDALPALAAELVRIPVDVIVTDSTSATLIAFAATRTIPIVMGASAGDPVVLGLAKSLSRPGGNV